MGWENRPPSLTEMASATEQNWDAGITSLPRVLRSPLPPYAAYCRHRATRSISCRSNASQAGSNAATAAHN